MFAAFLVERLDSFYCSQTTGWTESKFSQVTSCDYHLKFPFKSYFLSFSDPLETVLLPGSQITTAGPRRFHQIRSINAMIDGRETTQKSGLNFLELFSMLHIYGSPFLPPSPLSPALSHYGGLSDPLSLKSINSLISTRFTLGALFRQLQISPYILPDLAAALLSIFIENAPRNSFFCRL